jgi:hypothetical protein
VGGFPKEPANNPQSLRVKPPKYRNSFAFAGSFAGYCNSFYDKCVDQPVNNLQTTRKRKFRFDKCGKYRKTYPNGIFGARGEHVLCPEHTSRAGVNGSAKFGRSAQYSPCSAMLLGMER